MALTPPTVESLQEFRQEEFVGAENGWAEYVLAQATDALWVFTGIDSDPLDAREQRVVSNAIMELSLWLLAQVEHRDAIFSPFTGERIGSYSYQKMQQARYGARTGGSQEPAVGSGLFWLDTLFKMIENINGSAAWVNTEYVFDTGYEQQDTLRFFDPFGH